MTRPWEKLLSGVLVAAAAAWILWTGSWILSEHYVFWQGTLLPRDAQTLTLSGKQMTRPEAFLKFPRLQQLDARDTGMTLQQYEWFLENLPECTVIWEVPIQGSCYPPDTTELSVEQLTPEEMDSLVYLPDLKLLDVGSWQNYDAIHALEQRYPHCTLRWQIPLGGELWDSDTVSLLLSDADPRELEEQLCRFPRLESVLLTGTLPDQAQLKALQEQYPQIFFLWKMDALGMTLETDMEELDLSGARLDSVEELAALLPYFPGLKQVRLNASGLNQEALLELARACPHTHFVYDLLFEGRRICTDARELDLSNIPMESTQAVEEILPAFRNLEKVVMCQCGISSEDMDALDQRYPDIRFVWSVDLAGMAFRTDAVHFTPNRWGLSCDDENIADLRYCRDMVCVDIGHHTKVTSCQWVQNMPRLKYLVLAETGISDITPLTGHENLVFLELFLSKVTDYSPLTTCRALEDLNLCYTQGDPAPIAEMTWLKRLWWAGHWKARKMLADKLPDTYTEFLSLSSTGRGWREGQHYYDMRDFIGMEYMTG